MHMLPLLRTQRPVPEMKNPPPFLEASQEPACGWPEDGAGWDGGMDDEAMMQHILDGGIPEGVSPEGEVEPAAPEPTVLDVSHLDAALTELNTLHDELRDDDDIVRAVFCLHCGRVCSHRVFADHCTGRRV